MTSTQRYRRWYARRRFETFPWGDPGMIDEFLAWQWGLRQQVVYPVLRRPPVSV